MGGLESGRGLAVDYGRDGGVKPEADFFLYQGYFILQRPVSSDRLPCQWMHRFSCEQPPEA